MSAPEQEWTQVTKEELLAWVKAYPRRLLRDVMTAGEPPIVMWHDMSLSQNGMATWDTCVASYEIAGYGPEGRYQHRRQINE